MAYTVTELAKGTAARNIDGRTYTRVWRVVSDTMVHPSIVSFQVPVLIGDLFSTDFDAFCKSIDAQWENPDDSRLVYLVTATYETGTGGTTKPENEDPLQDRPDIRWGSRTVRLPVRFTNDVPPQAITNSVGQKFDPAPEEDFQILVYQYSHNIATYSEANARSYRGAINSDNFTLAGLNLDPYQARIQAIEAQNAERNGIRYWRESVTIEIVDDWRLTMVDEGTRKKSGIAAGGPGEDIYLGGGEFGVVEPILDAFGNPIIEQVLLDGAGGVLNGGEPFLLRFNTAAKPLKTFGSLGLPTTNTP